MKWIYAIKFEAKFIFVTVYLLILSLIWLGFPKGFNGGLFQHVTEQDKQPRVKFQKDGS